MGLGVGLGSVVGLGPGVLVKIGFEVGLGPGVELGTRVANGVTVGEGVGVTVGVRVAARVNEGSSVGVNGFQVGVALGVINITVSVSGIKPHDPTIDAKTASRIAK